MATEFFNLKKLEAALASGEPFLIDFFATWCAPCRSMAPTVERFAASHPEIHVGKVDIDAEPSVAERCGVQSVPTFILFREGREEARAIGAMPMKKLEQLAAVRESARE